MLCNFMSLLLTFLQLSHLVLCIARDFDVLLLSLAAFIASHVHAVHG